MKKFLSKLHMAWTLLCSDMYVVACAKVIPPSIGGSRRSARVTSQIYNVSITEACDLADCVMNVVQHRMNKMVTQETQPAVDIANAIIGGAK